MYHCMISKKLIIIEKTSSGHFTIYCNDRKFEYLTITYLTYGARFGDNMFEQSQDNGQVKKHDVFFRLPRRINVTM